MKTYPSRIDEFDLGKWGKIQFKQWLFPGSNTATFSESEVDRIAGFVSKGSFAIDIGGFIGDTTMPIALATGPTGQVLVFEPGPASYEFLNTNMKINKLHWVDLVPKAITTTEGPHTFYYTDEGLINGGNSDFLDIKHNGCGNPVPHEVDGVDLSKFVAEHYFDKMKPLSFVKIDTEGFDYAIVEANSDFFMAFKPTVQVEVYPFLSQRERARLMNSVAAIGYGWNGGEDVFLFPDPKPKDVICTPR